jgi:hypothetical protein
MESILSKPHEGADPDAVLAWLARHPRGAVVLRARDVLKPKLDPMVNRGLQLVARELDDDLCVIALKGP